MNLSYIETLWRERLQEREARLNRETHRRGMISLAVTLAAMAFMASFAKGQNPQTDITSLQNTLTQMQQQQGVAFNALQTVLTQLAKDIPTVPPPDPVVGLVKQSPAIYADLQTCAATPGCQVFAVIYSCPRPSTWQASTVYQFGGYVSDPNGNVYQLTAIDTSVQGPTSGAAAPTWGTPTVMDGPYTWSLAASSGVTWMCSTLAQQQPQPIAATVKP